VSMPAVPPHGHPMGYSTHPARLRWVIGSTQPMEEVHPILLRCFLPARLPARQHIMFIWVYARPGLDRLRLVSN